MQRLTLTRLQKEESSLQREPINGVIVTRQGLLNFHFCLYDLDEPYKNGFYHGLLELHESYPFNAPKLYFYTPNGRFECNMPICTSFTNYHQQSWTSAWNVRTLITATISFMYGEEPSYGCRTDTEQQRKDYANNSMQHNLKNQLFVKLFGQKLAKVGKLPNSYIQSQIESLEQKKEQEQQIQMIINKQAKHEQIQKNQNNRNNKYTKIGKFIIYGVLTTVLVLLVFYGFKRLV